MKLLIGGAILYLIGRILTSPRGLTAAISSVKLEAFGVLPESERPAMTHRETTELFR